MSTKSDVFLREQPFNSEGEEGCYGLSWKKYSDSQFYEKNSGEACWRKKYSDSNFFP